MAYRAGCGGRKRTQEQNKLTHGGIKNPRKQASPHTHNPINRSTCSKQISGYCFSPFAGRYVWQNSCIQSLCAFAEPPQKNALQKSSGKIRKEELGEKREGIAPEKNAPDGQTQALLWKERKWEKGIGIVNYSSTQNLRRPTSF